MSRSPAPVPDRWWTEADQAELDVLIYRLVGGIFNHRGRCAVCRAGFPPCQAVAEAIEALLDWRRGRQLLSRAEWLRERQAA